MEDIEEFKKQNSKGLAEPCCTSTNAVLQVLSVSGRELNITTEGGRCRAANGVGRELGELCRKYDLTSFFWRPTPTIRYKKTI